MAELTQEQIQKSIAAAFDSVDLINQLDAKETLTEAEQDSHDRNVEHLIIMMQKDWFVNELSVEQENQINTIIA